METVVIRTTRIVAALLILVNCSVFSGAQDPTSPQFARLKEPRISIKQNAKMLVVEAKGDPNTVAARAFGLVFQLYYSLKETPKGLLQPSVRARWPVPENTPKSEWVGLYALPVPDTVSALPQVKVPEGLKVSLTTWEYGEVAEILHVGPYDREEPTLRRLRDFIKQRGYSTVDGHEEEYIKGPTMNGKGDPETYMTIIRYQVRKTNHAEYIELFK